MGLKYSKSCNHFRKGLFNLGVEEGSRSHNYKCKYYDSIMCENWEYQFLVKNKKLVGVVKSEDYGVVDINIDYDGASTHFQGTWCFKKFRRFLRKNRFNIDSGIKIVMVSRIKGCDVTGVIK